MKLIYDVGMCKFCGEYIECRNLEGTDWVTPDVEEDWFNGYCDDTEDGEGNYYQFQPHQPAPRGGEE